MTYLKGIGLLSSSSQPYYLTKNDWRYFDEVGVDSLWLSDHIVKTFQPEGAYRSAWALLPALAEAPTSKAKIGVLVTCNSFRHPSVLLREILTVDEIAGPGRLIFGIGAGWYRAEHEIMGLPIPKSPMRLLESSLTIINTMLSEEVVTHLETADFPPIRHAIIRPRPKQRIPTLVGGHGPKVLQIAAKFADIWNSFGTPEEMRWRNNYLDDACLREHRYPGSLQRTLFLWRGMLPYDPWDSVQAYQDTVGMYAESGIDYIIYDAPKMHQRGVLEKCLSLTPSLTSV